MDSMVKIQNKKDCKPHWLKAPLPGGGQYRQVRTAVAQNRLATVCSEARCPNRGECWNSGTATFMILGSVCTRGCRFCAVEHGNGTSVDADEPTRVAAAAESMGLSYVVITSVSRDDLSDGGAAQFAHTVAAIRALNGNIRIEVLTPDYQGKALETVLKASPTVFAHNIETVERLSASMRHSRFQYRKSLETLCAAAHFSDDAITKSSLMLGLGETEREVLDSMGHLRDAGVKILVMGQYLQPTRKHAEVAAYITPEYFEMYAVRAYEMGFEYVAAAPLARTSWRAAEAYVKSRDVR